MELRRSYFVFGLVVGVDRRHLLNPTKVNFQTFNRTFDAKIDTV